MWDIFVSIFSGVMLLLIERFLVQNGKKETEHYENVIEPEVIIVREKEVRVENRRDSEETGFPLFLLLGIIAVVGYIKYSNVIHSFIVIVSISIGVMAIGMGLFCMKKGMRFKKDLNFLLIFNAMALVTVPWISKLTVKASAEQGLNIKVLKKQIELGNVYASTDIFDMFFLLYQVIGLVAIMIYILSILISNIYLVSLINVNLNSKLRKMWYFFLRRTYRFVSKPIKVVMFESIFLLMSFLFVSGVIWNLVKA